MQHLLFQACAMGDTITFLRLHQEDGSVLDQRTAGSQDTPLHLASRFNHKDLASVIINLQPYMVMTRNEEEETLLQEACRVGALDIVEQLLNHCPFLAYWRNRAKESALLIACSRRHSQVAFKLANTLPSLAWDESGSLACLLMAASEGETDIVKKILRESPSLANKKDEDGFSALHLASRNGKLEVIKEFLGEDPYLSLQRENGGRTPLHWAVMSGQLPVVEEFLLERDRPNYSVLSTDLINSADNNGDTVLHLAAKIKSTEILDFLVSRRGLKVHAPNKEGMTAIDISSQNSIGLRGKHTAARVDADIPKDLKRRMQFILLVHFVVTVIGASHDGCECNPENDIPGRETIPWWVATAFMLFMIAFIILCILHATTKMIQRPWDCLVATVMYSIEIAFVRFLSEIADGDPFYYAILHLLAYVPLIGFGWIWHKLAGLVRCWTDATGPKSD